MRTLVIGLAAVALFFASGCSCTAVEDVRYTTRPEMTWVHSPGSTYELVCWDWETDDTIAEIPDYNRGQWRPDDDLQFKHDYRLEVVDDATGEHSLCALVSVKFQVPEMFLPENAQEQLMSIEPDLRWQVADHPWPDARYTVQISDREDFREILWDRPNVGGPGHERHYIGVDQLENTEDDIDFVGIESERVLEPGSEYFWRVRVDYYKGEQPLGSGDWSEVRSFFVAPQPTGEFLQDTEQLTREDAQERHPDISTAFDLAYEAWTGDLSLIQVKRGRKPATTIEFDAGVERFSLGDSNDRSPDWDPEGEGIAFASNRGGSIYRIWYKKPEAGGHREITSTNRLDGETPDHSPAGGKIAYVEKDPDGNPWIWVIDVDGSKPTRLIQGFQPAWDRRGERIAFVAENRAGGRKEEINPYNVYVLDLEGGGGPVQLTQSSSNLYPAWSPDGRKIAYSSNRSGNWDIWEIDAKGGEAPRQLTNYLGTDTQPVWTPDGDYIVFSSTRFSKNFDIWMGRVPTR